MKMMHCSASSCAAVEHNFFTEITPVRTLFFGETVLPDDLENKEGVISISH